MKRIFVFILIVNVLSMAFSQNPPFIKWQTISSQHFNVVFEKGLENYAKNSIKFLENAYRIDTVTYGVSPKKITLFLFNRSAISNAYARLAPRQMVWYASPQPNTGLSITPWTQLLAIHEYRHVVQYKTLNKNFTKLNYWLFGQFGQLIFENISVPNWFWEGDAVYNETIHTKSGRGRISDFDLHLRSLLLSDKKIRFEPFLFRSYKTYYPNHYYLGYFMVSYVNRNYGQKMWDSVLTRTTKFSFFPFTFSNSLKKYTGFGTKKTFKKTFSELDSLWTLKYSNLDTTFAIPIKTKTKKTWTNYTSPYILNDYAILCLKSGLDDFTQIIIISEGNEKKIKQIAGTKISYASGKVVWTQFQPHPRWTEVYYSNVALLDIKTKKYKQITKHKYYFSPDISPDGKKIVVVERTPKLENNLVIIEAGTGKVIKKYNLGDEYPRHPHWSQNGSKITFTLNSNEGQGLFVLNLKTGKKTKLIDYQWVRMNNPRFYKNFILFNADPDGIANIFAIDTNTKVIYKITSRPYGAGNYSIYKDTLIFSDYTWQGFVLKKMKLDTSKWKKTTLKDTRLKYFLPAEDLTLVSDIEANIKISKPVKYQRFKHLVNIHSWTVLPQMSFKYMHPENATFYLFSSNHLQTMNIVGGATVFIPKLLMQNFISLSYKRFFPVLSLDLYAGKKGLIKNDTTNYAWKQNKISFSVNIPLNFTKGIYNRSLNFGIRTNYLQISADTNTEKITDWGNGNHFSYSVYLSAENRKFLSYRDISSPFGQKIYLNYTQIPKDEHKGKNYYGKISFYLPSIIKHHTAIINFETNIYDTQDLDFFNSVYYRDILPIGYTYSYRRNYKQAYKFNLTYNFPLFYPDFGINPLIYFKRVRGRIFFDYYIEYQDVRTLLPQTAPQRILSDIGIQLLTDFHIFRYNFFELNVGIQISYLIPEKSFIFEPVIMEIPLFH